MKSKRCNKCSEMLTYKRDFNTLSSGRDRGLLSDKRMIVNTYVIGFCSKCNIDWLILDEKLGLVVYVYEDNFTPPRYDEVYFDGLEWLETL